nr:MAG TPA: hypothetical protein [Bacteriophage sp.]
MCQLTGIKKEPGTWISPHIWFISVYFVLSLHILYRHKILFLYPHQKREVC